MSLPNAGLLAQLQELSDEEKNQLTLAGLADVDAGRTISHEEMKSWVRSLFLAIEKPDLERSR
jgi:predicted transcriptional regulator